MPASLTGIERLNKLLITYAMEETRKPPWAHLKFFTPADFEHPTKIHHVFLLYLDCMRWEATRLAGEAVKIVVTSDYRHGDTDSAHGQDPCVGIDMRVKLARQRHWLLQGAYNVGIRRVGVYCDDHHLHVDIADIIHPQQFPVNVTWVRECQ